MNSFSISRLSQLSGIKPHTIRIWEQRYNALQPNRSNGNTRAYDGSQLRRLLNIVSLSHLDYKVSELSSMSDKMLFELVNINNEAQIRKEGSSEYYISQLVAAGTSYDEIYFDKLISHCFIRYGIKQAYVSIIVPVLNRLGLMWAGDTIEPAQEHFISNLIRQKLFIAIDSLPLMYGKEETWVLFLPENEFHEIGLLFAYYLVKSHHKKAIYIGGNVPLDSLVQTIKTLNPTHLFTFFTQNDSVENIQNYIDSLTKHTSNNRLHIAGNLSLIRQLKINKKTLSIDSIDQLEQYLQSTNV